MIKLNNYNSVEKKIFDICFKNISDIDDKWMSSMVENYIYSVHKDVEHMYGIQFSTKCKTRYGLYHGKLKYFYPKDENNIKTLYSVISCVNGVKQGITREYFSNGDVEFEMFYNNDLLEGEYTKWYENRTIDFKYYYKNGKLDGEVKRYYKNQQLELITYYINGKENGIRKVYHSNGKLSIFSTVVDGEYMDDYKEWDEYGELIPKHLYTYDK